MDNTSKNNSFLYSWGFGKYGQIGSLDYQYVADPLEVKIDKQTNEGKQSLDEVDKVYCGEFHSGYITKNKNVYMFGKNSFGQLGISSGTIGYFCNNSISHPTKINIDKKIIKLALGGEHTLALTQNYELYTWGLNLFGQLGLGDFNERNYPQKVFTFLDETKVISSNELYHENVIDIAAGAQHSLILSENNSIYSCGFAKHFALGNYKEKESDLDEKNSFTKINLTKYLEKSFQNNTIKKVSCGVNHSSCVISQNEFVVWGKGEGADYEKPTLFEIIEKKTTPNQIVNNYPEIGMGENFFIVLSPQGDLFSSPANSNSTNNLKLDKIIINEKIREISVGYSHIIAIGNSNKLYAWGNNKNGQILEANTENILKPKEISIFVDTIPLKIACGGYHSVLLTELEWKNISMNISHNILQTLKFPINRNFDAEEYKKSRQIIDKILEKKNDIEKQIKEKELSMEEMKKFIEENKKLNNADSNLNLNRDSRNMKRKGTDKNSKVNLALLFDEDIKFEELQLVEKGDVGTGTFVDVKLSYWRKTLVAVKFLKKTIENEQENIKSFIEELYILKNLRHPNILLYLGACTAGPQYFLVSEYCEKGNLFDFLHTNKKSVLNIKEKIRIALEIAKGVNYLHCFNPPILHRDLKSLNILLDKNLQVKIADFGWARIRQDHMTKQRGTFQWMAPEVIRRNTYSEKADVFSFGIILWELMVQEPPYRNIDRIQVAKKVATDPKYRPKIPNDVPLKLKELMPLCWDHDPEQRLSFDQIIEYLEIFYSQI